jgi:hypothetical protein
MVFNPQRLKRRTLAEPRLRFRAKYAAMVSSRQTAQIPLSRASARSLRKLASVRRRHSSTQKSEQKVTRPLGTSRSHQRQRFLPSEPFGSCSPRTDPPFKCLGSLMPSKSTVYFVLRFLAAAGLLSDPAGFRVSARLRSNAASMSVGCLDLGVTRSTVSSPAILAAISASSFSL